MTDLHPIQRLAQKCAHANLPLAQAQTVFVTLYLADAVAIEGGNITRAADRSGMERTSFYRAIANARRKHQIGDDQ